MMNDIKSPELFFSGKTLTGSNVSKVTRLIKDLEGIFLDEQVRKNKDQDSVAYEVCGYYPVAENTKGGLFWGVTHLYPGLIGNEFMMTKGHFHTDKDSAEYYWGIEGEGMLIMMNSDGDTWAEKMSPGSLHYIPGNTAHRVANTGSVVLSFGACWPSNAGHDYDSIKEHGFTKRLLNINGTPTLINEK